jgi:N-acyl-D-amino-acid deacylase
MKELVSQAMRDGAMGVGSSLGYVPAFFAETEELIELAKVAAAYDGMYISHIRDEGDRLLESVEEVLTIARNSGVRAEIYHLKASGPRNWNKMGTVIGMIESARDEGLPITADMYTYTASSTGLNIAIPDWAQEGGHDSLVERLTDPATRAQILSELDLRAPDKTLLVHFRNAALRPLIGRTLGEVAEMRGTTPAETLLDLIVEDDSRIGAVYFTMSEENLKRQIRLPWMSFGSDGRSMAAEGDFLLNGTHPRAYGNFARLLGKYVREEKIIPLQDAIRRITHLPASNLKISRRGMLRPGYFADVVVFDPATIIDTATFEAPHQYAVGMVHVFVNGVQVLREGEHTGATPGRVVRGPGRRELE